MTHYGVAGLLALVLALSCVEGRTLSNDELEQKIKDLQSEFKTSVQAENQANKALKNELKEMINDLEVVLAGLITKSNTKINQLTSTVNTNKKEQNQAMNDMKKTVKQDQADSESKMKALINEGDTNNKQALANQWNNTKTKIATLAQTVYNYNTNQNTARNSLKQTVKEDISALETKLKEKMSSDKSGIQASLTKQWTDTLTKFENQANILDNFKASTNQRFEGAHERMSKQGTRMTESQTATNTRITEVRDNLKAVIDSFKNNTKINFNDVDAEIKQNKLNTKLMVEAVQENLENSRAEVDVALGYLETSAANQQNVVLDLARQTMLQQFGAEERLRSAGDSGVKILRGRSRGPENYYETALFGPAFNMMHDHSNYHDTVGMGELCVVMNGVEFRTRHNDYKLRMASTTDKTLHATEAISYPAVPPSVAGKASVDDQILEMREYFKAFQTQDSNHRDYKPYFKPVLCYLEGSWTLDTTKLDEPFDSDRHQIDADSWFDLQEKVRWSAYTGTKSRLENFSNLPTTIMAVNTTSGQPQYAQWNYRILCQPIKDDLPLSSFKLQDDLAYRVPREQRHDDVSSSRGARFRLVDDDDSDWERYTLLDKLMAQVPGKDNHGADITQVSFGDDLHDMGDSSKILNTGYYSRSYKYSKPGAQGLTDVARGFNDAHMWVAQTTQDRVAPLGLERCEGHGKSRVCQTLNTRMSYAIPLEIIYLTPLMSWNPYNLETVDVKTAKGGDAGGRTGGNSKDKALAGVAEKGLFYRTPIEFFGGKINKDDPADTVRNAVGVLDPNGDLQHVTASGVKILMQDIEGVGKVRLRYPITPVHGEGSAVWKELNALKDAVKGMRLMNDTAPPSKIVFEMATTTRDPPGEHTHEFSLTWEQYYKAMKGAQYTVETSDDHGHTHKLKIKYSTGDGWRYTKCGGLDVCWDGHASTLTQLTHVTDEMMDKQTMMNIMGDGMDMMEPMA